MTEITPAAPDTYARLTDPVRHDAAFGEPTLLVEVNA
jgi:hypothetical protein